jgi:hypothetical protein
MYEYLRVHLASRTEYQDLCSSYIAQCKNLYCVWCLADLRTLWELGLYVNVRIFLKKAKVSF